MGAAGSKGYVRNCGMHQRVSAWPRSRLIPPCIRSLSCLEKAFHCFSLNCRSALCPFPVPKRQAPLRLMVHSWHHPLHKLLPSISWHVPVPGVPVSAGFCMNVAEGWCPGVLGCSCSAERAPTAPASCASFSDAHIEEEQFRLRDVLPPMHRANP